MLWCFSTVPGRGCEVVADHVSASREGANRAQQRCKPPRRRCMHEDDHRAGGTPHSCFCRARPRPAGSDPLRCRGPAHGLDPAEPSDRPRPAVRAVRAGRAAPGPGDPGRGADPARPGRQCAPRPAARSGATPGAVLAAASRTGGHPGDDLVRRGRHGRCSFDVWVAGGQRSDQRRLEPGDRQPLGGDGLDGVRATAGDQDLGLLRRLHLDRGPLRRDPRTPRGRRCPRLRRGRAQRRHPAGVRLGAALVDRRARPGRWAQSPGGRGAACIVRASGSSGRSRPPRSRGWSG